MNDNSDEINKFLENKEFIGGLLSLVKQIVTKPQYEYIQVYYDDVFRSNFLGIEYGFSGFRIRGAYTNNIEMEDDCITLFNKLGSQGWKLFSVTLEGYAGKDFCGDLITSARNVYLFERRASADSDFCLAQVLDMLDIKKEKLYEDFNEEFNEEFNEVFNEE